MDPPVPIPNTEVKLRSADDTASARVWENRSLPGDYFVKSSRYAWAFFVFKKLTSNEYEILRIRNDKMTGHTRE